MGEPQIKLFSNRLNKAIAKIEGMTPEKLAREIRVAENTIRNWTDGAAWPSSRYIPDICRVLHVSADELFGITIEEPHNSWGIRWISKIPPWIKEGRPMRDIVHGIDVFKRFIDENRDAEDAFRVLNLSAYDASCALQAALRSGALQIVEVPQDFGLADEVKDHFHLHRVIVVKLPKYFDGSMIRAELVAFVAATEALPEIPNLRVLGLGSGYTILRVVEQSIPGRWQFKGTELLPLMTLQKDTISSHSANAIVLTMAQRHPGTVPLAHVRPEVEPPEGTPLFKKYQSVTAAFITVSGWERNTSRTGARGCELVYKPDPNYESFEYTSIGQMYDLLKAKKVHDKFKAEVLGLMLGADGEIIKDIEQENRDFVYPNDTGLLKTIMQSGGFVWIVAARKYKAEAVRLAITKGLANALVIDSEVANHLLNKS